MNGLNTNAVEEMLEHYQTVEVCMMQIKESLPFVASEATRGRLIGKLDDFQKDLDFTLICLQDEFVLGLHDSAVAHDFGCVIQRGGALAVNV